MILQPNNVQHKTHSDVYSDCGKDEFQLLKRFGFIPPSWAESKGDNPEDPISNLFLGIIPIVLDQFITNYGSHVTTAHRYTLRNTTTRKSPSECLKQLWADFKAIAIIKPILLQAIISQRISAYDTGKTVAKSIYNDILSDQRVNNEQVTIRQGKQESKDCSGKFCTIYSPKMHTPNQISKTRSQCSKCIQLQCVTNNVSHIESRIVMKSNKQSILPLHILQSETLRGILQTYSNLFQALHSLGLTKPQWLNYITRDSSDSPPAFRRILSSLANTLCIPLQSAHRPPDPSLSPTECQIIVKQARMFCSCGHNDDSLNAHSSRRRYKPAYTRHPNFCSTCTHFIKDEYCTEDTIFCFGCLNSPAKSETFTGNICQNFLFCWLATFNTMSIRLTKQNTAY